MAQKYDLPGGDLYVGTDAERAAETNARSGSVWLSTDSPGREDKFYGGTWVQTRDPSGAALVSGGPMEFRHYDDGSAWDYYAEAAPDASKTPTQLEAAAVWRVNRVNKSTGDEQWAAGGSFSLTAVDLADVQGHF